MLSVRAATMTDEPIHPAFPQPKDLEIDLWRYMDVSKFEWLLEYKRLFMPVTEKLGPDVLEGAQPAGDKAWWEKQAEDEDDKDKKQIIKRNSEIIVGFSNRFRKNYFVSCWHMNSSENEKMWEHYTNSNDSLVIRTKYNNLRSVLPSHINLGKVRYINHITEKLPSFNLFEHIMHKDTNYVFEKEVRAVAAPLTEAHWKSKEFDGHIFEMESDPEFIFYAPEVSIVNLIQNITLHPKSSSAFVERIEKLCSGHGLPTPVSSSLEIA
jgi:hypothetical protein